MARAFAKVKLAFEEFDTNKNGTMEVDELTAALEKVRLLPVHVYSPVMTMYAGV